MNNILRYGSGHKLQFDEAKMAKQMSHGTIKTIVEAIVEPVTNSDDSYCDMEDAGMQPSGNIDIHVIRARGGQCEFLAVIDQAAGMDKDKLDKAIVFAGKTSSFHLGRRRRGLLGRGLKEAIIKLGSGEIITVKDGVMSGAALWWDERDNIPKTDSTSQPATDEARSRAGLETSSGTAVRIAISKQIACPELKTLKEQIENHYALNDILSSPRRRVRLIFERSLSDSSSRKPSKETRELRYSRPPANSSKKFH